MLVALLGLLALSPLLTLLGGALRALVLFWPTMLVFGAVHSYVPFVPAFGWQATFFIVFLIGLLIPTGNATNSSN